MTRWKLTLEYQGSSFHGWQRQDDPLTIQGIIEQAIRSFCDETVTLHVAGRTDAGVHARAQVAHFDMHKDTNGNIIRDALNFFVRPHRISILEAIAVNEAFHARFSALHRRYRYSIINRRAALALRADEAWHVRRPLDRDVMQKAADILIGHHDFSTFRAQHCQAKSPLKTLDVLNVTQNEEDIYIDVSARSFLYHQVRNMVGSLSLVGTGHWSLKDFSDAFTARDRTKGGPTAPAHGLCFWGAQYP